MIGCLRRITLFSAIILLPWPGAAQNQTFFGLYPQYSQAGPIHKRLGYHLFVSTIQHTTPPSAESPAGTFRPGTDAPGTSLLDLCYYVQPSLTYKLSNRWQAGVGYAYVRYNLFGLRVNENRLWAQLTLTHSEAISRPRISHRLRYEERYPLQLVTRTWSLAQVGRYYVGATIPLFYPRQQSNGWYAAVANEAFFCFKGATNSPINAKNAFYGENWTYAGLGYNTRKLGKIELGYQFQNLIRNAAHEHRYLHLLQVQWATSLRLEGLSDWLLTPAY